MKAGRGDLDTSCESIGTLLFSFFHLGNGLELLREIVQMYMMVEGDVEREDVETDPHEHKESAERSGQWEDEEETETLVSLISFNESISDSQFIITSDLKSSNNSPSLPNKWKIQIFAKNYHFNDNSLPPLYPLLTVTPGHYRLSLWTLITGLILLHFISTIQWDLKTFGC